jgi:hypothetical protein
MLASQSESFLRGNEDKCVSRRRRMIPSVANKSQLHTYAAGLIFRPRAGVISIVPAVEEGHE